MNNKVTMPSIISLFCTLITVSLTLNASDPSKNVKGILEEEPSQLHGAARAAALNAAPLPGQPEQQEVPPSAQSEQSRNFNISSGAGVQEQRLSSGTPVDNKREEPTLEARAASDSIRQARLDLMQGITTGFAELKGQAIALLMNPESSNEEVEGLSIIKNKLTNIVKATNQQLKETKIDDQKRKKLQMHKQNAERTNTEQLREKQIENWTRIQFNSIKSDNDKKQVSYSKTAPIFPSFWKDIKEEAASARTQSIERILDNQEKEIKQLQQTIVQLEAKLQDTPRNAIQSDQIKILTQQIQQTQEQLKKLQKKNCCTIQ